MHLSQHGVMLNVADHGVLISGAPGIGKSSLALSLLHQGYQIVADDVVELKRQDTQLLGSCPPQTRGFLHHRELGLLDIRQLFGQQAICPHHLLHVVIKLTETPAVFPVKQTTETTTELLGIAVPTISLSIDNPCPLSIRIISWLKNRPHQQQTLANFKQKQQQLMQQ